MADEYRLGHVYEDVLTAHILVLAHAGAVDQALAALERAETADLPFGPVDALRGIVLIRRGDFRDGVHALVPGLARLRRVDRQLLLPYAVGVAAWGVAALGDAEEAAALLVGEQLDGEQRQAARLLEPAQVAGRHVKLVEPVRNVRVVVEIARAGRLALPVAASQPSAVRERSEQELR